MFKTQNLYQNDEKWKNVKLGNSNETIGGWGCLLTSVTMMLNGIGYNETPETVNEKMKKAGGFQGAFFIPSVLPYVWPNCAYRDMQPCEKSPAPIAEIDAALETGKPVILQVDWNKQAGIQTHFVLVKEKKGNDYILYDPYKYGGDSPEKEVLLTSRYKFNGATIEKEISAVLWFDAVSAAPAEPPKMKKAAVPADRFLLYATADDLALRAEPSVNGYLWKRLVMGTELIALETTGQNESQDRCFRPVDPRPGPGRGAGICGGLVCVGDERQSVQLRTRHPGCSRRLQPAARRAAVCPARGAVSALPAGHRPEDADQAHTRHGGAGEHRARQPGDPQGRCRGTVAQGPGCDEQGRLYCRLVRQVCQRLPARCTDSGRVCPGQRRTTEGSRHGRSDRPSQAAGRQQRNTDQAPASWHGIRRH
jgi:hypothetical protein